MLSLNRKKAFDGASPHLDNSIEISIRMSPAGANARSELSKLSRKATDGRAPVYRLLKKGFFQVGPGFSLDI
jgi:hypothetical protein